MKAAEAAHELAIDPAHKREADRIEKAGGRIKRVVLDHEFKSIAASRMNRVEGPHQLIGAQNWPPNWTCQSSKISWRCPIWIEYEDAAGQHQHRDLEVVTRHYQAPISPESSRRAFAW